MSGKRPYLPNNWEEYYEAPDDMFIPHTFVELMTWKVANWELPSSVACVIRTTNVKTKKVKEFTYQKSGAARNKIEELMLTPDIEFTVVDHEAIHHLSSEHEKP